MVAVIICGGAMPRHPNGKLYKRQWREKYRQGRATRIV